VIKQIYFKIYNY